MSAIVQDYSPLRLVPAGNLIVPTGQLIARDPHTSSHVAPFKVSVAPGTYPVWLSIVTIEDEGDVIGAASIHFTQDLPISWTMALPPGRWRMSLKAGQIFGYYVDSGLGCFFDGSLATRRASWKAKDDRSFFLQLQRDRTALPGSGCEWGSTLLDPDNGGNMVFFTSGMGDNCYASYFGYGSGEIPVALLTDFRVLGDGMDEQAALTALYSGHLEYEKELQ